ncbi:MAG: glycosidase [Candidatus Marinimicrobia bacterium]|nr:glycosidase [Candidatus Neomarinimicrobiota bacterium]
MQQSKVVKDKIILSPKEIDIQLCPIHQKTGLETYILGAFNPALTRLSNGNLLLMARIAESLKEPIKDQKFRMIRWHPVDKYIIEEHSAEHLDTRDPRKFRFLEHAFVKVYGLTSFSWLLPVETTPDGLSIIRIHYDKIIAPRTSYQEYGIEDPRITQIGNTYYMTTCSVSSERHSTTLYSSQDGLNYHLEGIILDHQNKDMVLFPEKINGYYMAMTRPMGELYFSTYQDQMYLPGPSINLAQSPDLLHWKPIDSPFLRPRKNSKINLKLGAGAQPILTDRGWLILFHGVEKNETVGIYRTFRALLDKEHPWIVKDIDICEPLLQSNTDLMTDYQDISYLSDVVFTTGIVEADDHYIIASGEDDLCCRITHINKKNIF